MNDSRTDSLQSALNSIRVQLSHCENHRNNLKMHLNSSGIEDLEKPIGVIQEETVLKIFSNGDVKDNLVNARRPFLELVYGLEHLKRVLGHFLDDEPSIDKKAEERENKIYWNQQRKIWLSWFQKLLRWMVGAIVVILIYSFGVYLSDIYPSFFHMPVHDWIEPIKSD